MITNKTQKGFTLIELLMVVALIAILSTMILVMLDSGREKAEVNRYFSYGTQMHRLAADVAAAGQFDSGKTDLADGDTVCLSEGCTTAPSGGSTIKTLVESTAMTKALTYLTELPKATKENSQSPYNSTEGVTITYKPGTAASRLNVVRLTMYLVGGDGNKVFVVNKCNSIGWSHNAAENSCYLDVKLHSRL